MHGLQRSNFVSEAIKLKIGGTYNFARQEDHSRGAIYNRNVLM